jgi:hypothetical protein
MASNVPLTIQAAETYNYYSQIVIGSLRLSPPKSATTSFYWIVVLDRADLSVEANFTFTSNDTVPPLITPFIEGSQYIMILTTQQLGTDRLPTGAFYQFLQSQGAGVHLTRLEQIYEALNCGTWGNAAYTYVCILDKDPQTSGFEFSDIYQFGQVITMQFIPFQVGQGVLYSPALL